MLETLLRWSPGTALATALAVAGLATPAFAVPIDLTGPEGATLAGAGSGVLGDPDLGAITFSATPSGSAITHSPGSGLGIDCSGSWSCAWDEPSEIDTFEVMQVVFAESVVLNTVTVANLFPEPGLWGFAIEGGYLAGESFVIHFTAEDPGAAGGWLTFDVDREVEWFMITAEYLWRDNFSLAGFDADLASTAGVGSTPPGSPMPEPNAVTLFAIGLAVIGSATRRRR
jgi:hypothetical protein